MYDEFEVHYLASELPEPLPTLDAIRNPVKWVLCPDCSFGLRYARAGDHYAVKSGCGYSVLSLRECWTMVYLQKSTSIGIPRVYAIFTDKDTGHNHLIMEYIKGKTLEECWEHLSHEEKESVAAQLKAYLTEMRALPPVGGFERALPPGFGDLGTQTLQLTLLDFRALRERGEERVYQTVREFYERMAEVLVYRRPDMPRIGVLFKHLMEKTFKEGPPVFTHGDLLKKNIMLQNDGKVILIDWDFAGWMPEFWEYSSAQFCGAADSDWSVWLSKFMEEWIPEALLINSLEGFSWGRSHVKPPI